MYNAMQDHWAEFGPPVHISVAAFMGWKGNKKKKDGNGMPVKPGTGEGFTPQPNQGSIRRPQDPPGHDPHNLENLERMFSGTGGVI